MIEAVPLDLDEEQSEALRNALHEELTEALELHEQRATLYAQFLRDYKSKPEHEKKNFPWPGASNVVVPLVAVTVDAIVARLQKAIIGSKDFAEVEIKAPQWEPLEKDIRDWINWYVEMGGLKGRLRTIAFDMALYGAAYAKAIWVEEVRDYHRYDDAGNVVKFPVPGFTGTRWYVASPNDLIWPEGFDEWANLPWVSNRLRYTKAELKRLEAAGEFQNLDAVWAHGKTERVDQIKEVQNKNTGVTSGSAKQYEFHEVHGLWEIPGRTAEGEGEAQEATFEEVILTYHLETRTLVKAIMNPHFGQQHMIVQIPFLNQPHEIQPMGVAEQVGPFQREASTSHNQMIDAATASNAGIVVVHPDTNLGNQEDIYPGKKLVTENPDKDVRILHMNAPSPAIASIEEKAAYNAEKRSGMSSYNLGMESSTVGSRATATGTTALISEGNIRQWVSIDDMRDALVELLYLTIQMEQQYRPEGFEWTPGRTIQFPQGDVRTSLGLKLKVTSEQVNRDLELQQLQVLMQVLNEYYARLSGAAMMIFNPQVPPPAKMAAAQIMIASHNIVKRFVDRFDVENADMIVPDIQTILQGAQAIGQGAMGGPPQPGQGAPPQGPGGGPPQGPGPAPGARQPTRAPQTAGASSLPV